MDIAGCKFFTNLLVNHTKIVLPNMENYYHESKKLLNNLITWVENLENVSLTE